LRVTVANNPTVWEARLQLAALDLAERNFAAAEEAFTKMYQATGDGRALMGLTESYTQQNQFDKAIDVLKGELKKTPDRVDYIIALGNICVQAGRYPDAINHFKAAIEKQPRSADLWTRLGETQRRNGDSKSAFDSFTKSKELAPNNILPYIQIALMLDSNGEKEKARPYYEQVLKLQPDHPVALNNLAFMLADTGMDIDQALTMAQRAKQKLPSDSNVADTLGWIYIKKHLDDSAISIFKELTRQEPERAVFHYHLAMALAQKGDKPQAKKELEMALHCKPNKDEETKIHDLMLKVG
jgi:tetratricopeptide (TPR) repeat protein